MQAEALVDSGATTSFIKSVFVKKHNLVTIKLANLYEIKNADGTPNKAGQITHRVEGEFIIKGTKLPTPWYVADIGKTEILFGMP